MNKQLLDNIIAQKRKALLHIIIFQHLTSIKNLYGSLERYKEDCHALSNFRKSDRTNLSIEDYTKKRTRFNKLSIPCQLIKKLFGFYRDENKQAHRIPYSTAVEKLIADETIKVFEAGTIGQNRKQHIQKKYLLCWKFLEQFFAKENEATLNSWLDLNSNKYSDLERKLIHEFILKRDPNKQQKQLNYLRAREPDSTTFHFTVQNIQPFVDENILSEAEAMRIIKEVQWMDRDVKITPRRNGFDPEALDRHSEERMKIYGHLISNQTLYGLHEDAIKHFKKLFLDAREKSKTNAPHKEETPSATQAQTITEPEPSRR